MFCLFCVFYFFKFSEKFVIHPKKKTGSQGPIPAINALIFTVNNNGSTESVFSNFF